MWQWWQWETEKPDIHGALKMTIKFRLNTEMSEAMWSGSAAIQIISSRESGVKELRGWKGHIKLWKNLTTSGIKHHQHQSEGRTERNDLLSARSAAGHCLDSVQSFLFPFDCFCSGWPVCSGLSGDWDSFLCLAFVCDLFGGFFSFSLKPEVV